MASDPMLDVLREIVDDADPSEGFHATLSSLFMEKHGPALLARLEAMEKAVAEEREACAAIADEYDGPGCSHGMLTQLGDSARTRLDIAAAIRARGQS